MEEKSVREHVLLNLEPRIFFLLLLRLRMIDVLSLDRSGPITRNSEFVEMRSGRPQKSNRRDFLIFFGFKSKKDSISL